MVGAAEAGAWQEVDETDILFECVQMTYGNGASEGSAPQNSVQMKVSASEAERVATPQTSQTALRQVSAPAPIQQVQAQLPLSAPSILVDPSTTAEPMQVEKTNSRVAQDVELGASDLASDDQSLEALGAEERETIGPFQVYRETEEINVISKHSVLLRTKHNLIRTAIVDPEVCDIVQFTPREISIIGRTVGATHVTFWFEDGSFQPVTFLVRTKPDPALRDMREEQFKLLENQIARMFPNSKVSLLLLANKLIVRGQARSVDEAAEIMRILREDTEQWGSSSRNGSYNAAVTLDAETGMKMQGELILVNQLRIPGIQQVSLKVKLADLERSHSDSSGVDFSLSFDGDKLLINSLMGALTGGGGLISYNSADVKIGIEHLTTQGVIRQMSEANLLTMSGTSATMVAGGEIPISRTMGIQGASGVQTDFRPYGTVITFVPRVLDKDLIHLQISTEFSSLDEEGNTVTGVPNLTTRTVENQVQLREGQTFAIATVLEDNYSATKSSNVPIFSGLLGHKQKTRGEREMVVLVSPELVAPMEPEEVPPLPGFDVTEPTNAQFHFLGRLEGNPTLENRSTVWPSLRNRYLSGGSAIISGPYGH